MLHADHHDTKPARYVALRGEADGSTADHLQAELRRLLAPSWLTVLRVDLSALRFLNCAALSALLTVRAAATQCGQQLSITGADGCPARVLALTQADLVFGHPPLPGHPRTPLASPALNAAVGPA
ncbi:STAS domain-containing protein [Micromonospora endolithica]|uniref:STAS domain-containing protein n=1 Tax=Micromonospora endolithica TaxID=230091 RepID=UPI0013156F73|nr:STAS domain-containing protein [Micromonospora endolithica]